MRHRIEIDKLVCWFLAGVVVVMIIMGSPSWAAEVSSIRDSQYEWQCETAAGVLISGHTRQDKAFQSCINAAMDGNLYIVRGGTYRVTVSGIGSSPSPVPPEPPPIPPPDPPVDPPTDTAQSKFGPVTAPLSYPGSISTLAQDKVRWEITFTVNSLPTGNSGAMGLASRDQTGQDEAGHLSVWLRSDGGIRVRHQDIAGGAPNIQLDSDTKVQLGVEYKITVSIDIDEGIGLFVEGVLEASSPLAFGLLGNNLPLVVGGLCSTCTADGTVGPDRPVDGSVYMEIWDDPLPLPVVPISSLMLNWTKVTERTDNTLLGPGLPDKITIYKDNNKLVDLDGESIMYEATNLLAGTHCFEVTAWAGIDESARSNTVCKPTP
jgi:hypothetical protein